MENLVRSEQLTLETLPKAFVNLANDVDEIKQILKQQQKPIEVVPTWFNIAELCNYIPDHPARQTVYAWVQHGKIPNHKGGKKLRFLKSEIDEWLKQSKRLTKAEASTNVTNYLTSKKK